MLLAHPWSARPLTLCCLLGLLAACAPSTDGADAPVDSDADSDTGEIDLPPGCTADLDCDDGDPCNGVETCLPDGACATGDAFVCDEAGTTCVVEGGAPICDVRCPIPTAPVLDRLRATDRLVFTGADPIQTAVLAEEDGDSDAVWVDDDTVDPSGHTGSIRVLARAVSDACTDDDRFDHTYTIVDAFPPAAGSDGSLAVPLDDPRLSAWADAVASYTPGTAVDAAWQDTSKALGTATGTSGDILSLGRGGQVTLTFASALANGPGPDLAVFENSFSDTFLELGWVEVSSDGLAFARFDSITDTPDAVDAFGAVDPTAVHGLAGVYRQGFGTPFDLETLRWSEPVQRGLVDLDAIRWVRVVDIVGDGTAFDSFGNPIHDPYPTSGSAGFDLDAIAAMQESQP